MSDSWKTYKSQYKLDYSSHWHTCFSSSFYKLWILCCYWCKNDFCFFSGRHVDLGKNNKKIKKHFNHLPLWWFFTHFRLSKSNNYIIKPHRTSDLVIISREFFLASIVWKRWKIFYNSERQYQLLRHQRNPKMEYKNWTFCKTKSFAQNFTRWFFCCFFGGSWW